MVRLLSPRHPTPGMERPVMFSFPTGSRPGGGTVHFLWIGFNSPTAWHGFLSLHSSMPNTGWIGGRVVADSATPLGFYFDPDTTVAAEITAEGLQTTLIDIGGNPYRYAGSGLSWYVVPVTETIQ